MLSLFDGWASTTTITFLLSSSHSPLHHSIFGKFSYSCSPSQGIFFASAVQTPVSLSGNNWSVVWSNHPASLCYKLDVLGSGTLKPLSVRTWRCLHHRLCIVFSVFDDDDGHKREQTSCLVVGAEIPIVALKRTYINVTTFWVFTLVASLCGIFDHRIIFLYGYLVTAFCLVISLASYTKIFHSLRYHQAQVSDQQQPSQINALNMARFRKAVYSALWVQSASVVCYVPVYTVGIVITLTKKYSLLLAFAWKGAVILLSFNSTLNPFLYCWKISEVRKAVKQTLKEALCWNRSAFNGSSDPQSRLIKSWLLLESSRQISYWIKTNKWLNGIVAQAVVDSLYISENNLTTD